MSDTYHNEFDPFAAEWCRQLMAANEVPQGHVDERSIADVLPADVVGYRQCHFFSGVGGWSRALRLAGWPESVPVWTGSCPCQPFSVAGKGKAEKDDRDLWPAFFRLVAANRPPVVLGEQVASADVVGDGDEAAFVAAVQRGDTSRANAIAERIARKEAKRRPDCRLEDLPARWVSRVRSDLEGIGYAVRFVVFGSHSVGSPNIRQRLYWAAWLTAGDDHQRAAEHGSESLAVSEGQGRSGVESERQAGVGERSRTRCGGADGGVADAGRAGVRAVGLDVGGPPEGSGREAREQRVRADLGDGGHTGIGAGVGQPANAGHVEGWGPCEQRSVGEDEAVRREEAIQPERRGNARGVFQPASDGRGQRGSEPSRGSVASGCGDDDSGWSPVVYSGECDEDGSCPRCGIDYAECGCCGPNEDSVEYLERDGILYGRRVGESFQSGLEGLAGDGHDRNQPGRVGAGPDGPVAAAGPVGVGRMANADGGDAGDGDEQRSREHGQQPQDDGTDPAFWVANPEGQREDQVGGIPEGPGTVGDGGFWGAYDLVFCRDGKWRRIPPQSQEGEGRDGQAGVEPLLFGMAARVPGGVVRCGNQSLGVHPLTAAKVEGRVGLLRGFGNAINVETAAAFVRAVMKLRGMS